MRDNSTDEPIVVEVDAYCPDHDPALNREDRRAIRKCQTCKGTGTVKKNVPKS